MKPAECRVAQLEAALSQIVRSAHATKTAPSEDLGRALAHARDLLKDSGDGRLTSFWIVQDPTPDSTLEDICFETTPERHADWIIGGSLLRGGSRNEDKERHTTYYLDGAKAMADATKRLAKRRRS